MPPTLRQQNYVYSVCVHIFTGFKSLWGQSLPDPLKPALWPECFPEQWVLGQVPAGKPVGPWS